MIWIIMILVIVFVICIVLESKHQKKNRDKQIDPWEDDLW